MNLNTAILKKLTRLILFGFSAGILLAISAQPINLQPVSAQDGGLVCNQNEFDAGSCRRCNSDGSAWINPDFGNYRSGEVTKEQWCSCAQRHGDVGSLMRGPLEDGSAGACSQAPRGADNPSQPARSCDDFAGNYGVCGQRTYDRCNLRYNGTQAFYDCQASQNSSCSGTIRCSTEDRQANNGGNNPPGGSTAVANCPTGTVPTTGSNQNTVVCVAQAQTQTNNQTQTGGNQTQTAGNQTVTAYGGAGGAGGSANVTINGAGNDRSGGTRVIYATNGNVGVGTSVGQRVVMVQNYGGVKELPKTGLPALAWASLAFLPAGMRLKRFAKIKEDFSNNPNFLWEQRKFRADS